VIGPYLFALNINLITGKHCRWSPCVYEQFRVKADKHYNVRYVDVPMKKLMSSAKCSPELSIFYLTKTTCKPYKFSISLISILPGEEPATVAKRHMASFKSAKTLR